MGVSRRRSSLAGQILLVQVLLFAVVLTGVGAVSVSQSRQASADAQERRVRQVAEYVASLPLVRRQLGEVADGRSTAVALTVTVEQLRTTSDVAVLLAAGPDGRVAASPADPRLVGTALPEPPGGERGDPSWLGEVDLGRAGLGERRAVAARVPVLADDPGTTAHPPGSVVGAVLVAQDSAPWSRELRTALPDLATYLGMSALVGLLGAWLLARRVKSQTLGLEPDEIASLATHREAVLRGIREGVLALDPDGVVTVANDAARELLDLPADAVGRRVDALGLPREVVAVLTRDPAPSDRPVVADDRLLVLNRTVLHRAGGAGAEPAGTVTTMRDRTELVALQHELGLSRTSTQALRAQTHEFANRLHTISGLVQLGRYEEVVHFVDRVSRAHADLGERISARVGDPALAALLVASTSVADERDVDLVLAPGADLPRVGEDLSDDLVTVVGNLVDNAVDAAAGAGGGTVEVDVRGDGSGGAVVVVRDDGPGVDPDLLPQLVQRGTSTKETSHPGGRGVGLTLVQLVCHRRGGSLQLRRGEHGGARFTAVLPARERVRPGA
ncbi:sensor histidine kinase [Kineococcus indalonis]|uniref:sensor histidine kinase n=1 Tax=Kineococcus indalonis TaxID=2696566 RepID=UPI0014127B25|nr:ATP-binding protein [Kineococcus indalonis]NAZ85371.1 GHKL domain-containing protein [Kineococcus indalonis]